MTAIAFKEINRIIAYNSFASLLDWQSSEKYQWHFPF